MSDELQPGDSQPETPTASTVRVHAAGDVTIGGDIVGRDKIVTSTVIGYTADQVSALIAQISGTFQPKPFDGRCPYKGLEAFGEQDAEYFFGRESLIEELAARVSTSRAVVIAGPSGNGKSSLIRAGLIPALKRGAAPGSERWLYSTLTPGRDPLEQLALAIARLARSPAAGDYMRAHAGTDPSTLHKAIEAELNDWADQRAIIFVDQFEETFTSAVHEAERVAFLELLTHAASLEGGRAVVLFALRSDFVASLATYPRMNDLLNQQFFQVSAMQPEELVRAIALPALRVGLRIDADLIAQIVNDMGDEPGALPLMQFALKDLFDAQQAAGGVIALTRSHYLERGGIHKALERHADAAFGRLSEGERQLARRVFSGLVHIEHGTQDTRRTALFSELVPVDTDAAMVEGVVRKLADARLITTDEREEAGTSESGARAVTLAHEKLLDAWPWLRRLVNENREAIELQNRIAEDAEEWTEHGRDSSYLYSGVRLAAVHERLGRQKLVLRPLGHAFVQAGMESEQAARRARERQRNSLLVGALVIAAVMAVLGLFSLNRSQEAGRQAATAQTANTQSAQNLRVANENAATAEAANTQSAKNLTDAQQQARIALSRQLAAQAVALVQNKQLDLALLLDVEALRIEDTFEARNVLLSSLQFSPRLTTVLRNHMATATSIAFSPDGKSLAIAGCREWEISNCFSYAGEVTLWDISDLRVPRRLGTISAGGSTVNSLAYSSDSRLLAFGPASFESVSIDLWDVSDPGTPRRLGSASDANRRGRVSSVAFSPDDKTLAEGSADKTILLWDVSDPSAPRQLGDPLVGHTGAVTSVAFSPDGKNLASGSGDKTILLWDVSDPSAPRQLGDPLVGHTGAVNSVAFNPDGNALASGSQDGTATLWDVSDPSAPHLLGGPLTGHTAAVTSVAFSRDGKILASGSSDKTILLWDISDPGAPRRLGNALVGLTEGVEGVAFSPAGQSLASVSLDSIILLWDISDPSVPRPLGNTLTGHRSSVTQVAFSPDGQTLASVGSRVFIWDISNPDAPQELGHPLEGYSVAFNPVSKTLAVGSTNQVPMWDLSDPRAPRLLGGLIYTDITDIEFESVLESVVFSPDGQTLASVSGGADVALWDVSDPTTQRQLAQGFTSAYTIAFNPMTGILASGYGFGGQGVIDLWDVSEPGTPRLQGEVLDAHTELVTSVAFSPNGQTLASGSMDKTILLWDVSDPNAPRQLGNPLTGHTSTVRSVAFSSDGKWLATASEDKTILLWDVLDPSAPRLLGGPLIGHTNIVRSVAFSPDGKRLASGGDDNTIILWDVDLDLWKARACAIAGRNLTRAEWNQYFSAEPYRKTCEQWPDGP